MDATTMQMLLVVIAYLIGSINSAILLSRVMNLPDPRTLGSGNPGATNVLRTGNKFAAGMTLLGDLLKGLIPVAFTKFLIGDPLVIAAVSVAALIGHMYPIYYRFQGGKGVATTLGVLLGIDWLLGLIWIAIWLFVALVFRYSSLAALVATFLLAIILWVWFQQFWIPLAFIFITFLVFLRHASNITNLLSGKESKIGKKAS